MKKVNSSQKLKDESKGNKSVTTVKPKIKLKNDKDKMMFSGFGNMLVRPINLSIFTAMTTEANVKSA